MSLENSFLEAGILESNYFDLFSLPLSFDVDQKQLKKRFRALQRSYHPDRYASATASERRLAAQFSAHINTAHTTLENPTLRAEHMLGVVGIDADTSTTTIRDPEFLMRQMELREQFDDAVQAGNLEQLQSLAEEVGVQYLQCQTAFSMQIASRLPGGEQPVNGASDDDILMNYYSKLQFFEKLHTEILGVLRRRQA